MTPTTNEVTTNVIETKEKKANPTQLFAMHEQVTSLKNVQSDMRTKLNSAVSSEEGISIFEAKLEGLTTEQVDAMTDDEVSDIYNIDGKQVSLLLPSNSSDEATMKEMRRDFIKVLIEQNKAMAELDIATQEFEKEMAIYDEEMKQLLQDFGDVSNFMRSQLEETILTAKGEDKPRLISSLNYFDDATNLNDLFETYSKLNRKNTLQDYAQRSDVVYAKYNKTIKKLNLTFDITNFENLEAKYLGEKYQTHPNLFAFLVIKYGAYIKNPERHTHGVFFSQLALNLKMLYNNSFASEDKKKTFIANIERTLDLFI